MDNVREVGAAKIRIKAVMLLRVDEEVVRGESAIVLVDPRRAGGFKKLPCLRPFRIELYGVKYEVRGMILLQPFPRLI